MEARYPASRERGSWRMGGGREGRRGDSEVATLGCWECRKGPRNLSCARRNDQRGSRNEVVRLRRTDSVGTLAKNWSCSSTDAISTEFPAGRTRKKGRDCTCSLPWISRSCSTRPSVECHSCKKELHTVSAPRAASAASNPGSPISHAGLATKAGKANQ